VRPDPQHRSRTSPCFSDPIHVRIHLEPARHHQGAEAAALAGERDDAILAALSAAQMDEAALKQPALEIRLELALHELRQPARFVGALEKRGEVRA